MEDEFTLSTLIPRELNERFQIACARRRKKKKAAVAEALECWIVGYAAAAPVEGPKPAEISPEDQAALDDLQAILAGGNKQLIDSAVLVLNALHGQLPPVRRRNGSD